MGDSFLGKRGAEYRGHEFHYSSQTGPRPATSLFKTADAMDQAIPPAGCRQGTVMGAYIHLIDRVV